MYTLGICLSFQHKLIHNREKNAVERVNLDTLHVRESEAVSEIWFVSFFHIFRYRED